MTVTRALGRRYGLRIDGSTRSRLARVLAAGAARTGREIGDYAVIAEHDAAELDWVVEQLTVQETAFFRHPQQFEVVAERVATGAGVIWSAGCANGQEAWSLAMVLAEAGARGWSVVATDVSEGALERARQGVYAERELRGLDHGRRGRFLRACGDGAWTIAPALRSRVRFARHNLVAEPPPPDVDGRLVLCRNVLIYLRREQADRFLARLRARMPEDGMLLIGAGESLPPDHPAFAAERVGDVYVHQPRGRVSSPPPPGRPSPVGPAPRREPPLPTPAELVAAGEAHAAAGRHAEAVAAFRKATYLAPDDALAHARLGFALEAAGDEGAARRAFRAARAALARGVADHVDLEGWSVDELRRVVEERASR
jgi:chemotaxis protein methyltransferase CheR